MCIDCLDVEDLPDANRDYRFIATDIEFMAIADVGEVGVVAVFEWDEADPWVVTMDLGGPTANGRPWQCDRELLRDGLHDDAGLGVVRFRGDVLHPDRRLMILDSPNGRAVFRFDPIEVSFFVESVDRHVRHAAEDRTERST